MTKYCTLAYAKSELDTNATSQTLSDAQVLSYIEIVSQRIDGLLQPNSLYKKRPFFAPYIEARSVPIRAHRVNSGDNTISLYMYLLSLTSVLAGAQDVTSSVAVYPSGFTPYSMLQITSNDYTWYSLEQSPAVARAHANPLTVTGTWGWHGDWANAWVNTSTLAGAMTNAQTTLDVLAGTGTSFSPGHMLKIGSEYMEVLSISTDKLTIKRGVNGSTAAVHNIADVVAILDISDDIQRITARHAAALYARRGAFEVQQLTQVGVVQYPQDLLMEMQNTLNIYRM